MTDVELAVVRERNVVAAEDFLPGLQVEVRRLKLEPSACGRCDE
jgi:hypothetical protein